MTPTFWDCADFQFMGCSDFQEKPCKYREYVTDNTVGVIILSATRMEATN